MAAYAWFHAFVLFMKCHILQETRCEGGDIGSQVIIEQEHNKTDKMTYGPSEDSDQPGHSPSLVRVFVVRMKKHLVLGYL